jgi:hypothetical protein
MAWENDEAIIWRHRATCWHARKCNSSILFRAIGLKTNRLGGFVISGRGAIGGDYVLRRMYLRAAHADTFRG